MASDETITTIRSSMHDDDDDLEDDDDDEEHHNHRYNMSRLSMCTTNIKHPIYDGGDDDGVDDIVTVNMSRLSVEDDGSEVEADGELSDEKEGKDASIGSVDDSDKETGWLSLPAAPRRSIRRRGGPTMVNVEAGKEYASDNEVRARRSRRKESRKARERWLERAWGLRSKRKESVDEIDNNQSGENECVVIAQPKGGERCLCMDMNEVKACKDLGFELQHEWTLEIPSMISGSTIDTDSGGNSPIANWRISSPGDDPRDVKARLKVWAQAVALASATRLTSPAD